MIRSIIHDAKITVYELNKDLLNRHIVENVFFFFLKLGFTPCKAEQPLLAMELQEKKHKKDYTIQKICLERTYS